MKSGNYKFFVSLAVAAASVSFSFSENLDAALEAQKKKAQARVYSERAILTDHKLTVPRTPTEQERDLDRKLEEMEAKLDSRAPVLAQPLPLRPTTATIRPEEKQNWLTPAVLDNDKSDSQTNETDNAWLVRELERQKELKDMEAAKKENAQIEKLLRGKTQELQKISPELNQLKQYQLAPPKLFGSRDNNKDPEAPSYMTPRSGTPNPLDAVGLAPKKEYPAAPSPFSPAARLSPTVDTDPLRSIKSPAINPNLGLPMRQTRSTLSPLREDIKPTPPTPLEMIRISSPINRQDPFTDDPMPRIKSSIWE